MKKIILCAVLLLFCVSGTAIADKYISKDCENNGDGTSWSCAESPGGAGALNQVPSAGTSWCNFDGTAWVRGNIYWIAGSDTPYNGVCFRNYSGSGDVTLKKATADSHGTDTGWVASYGTKVAVLPYMQTQAFAPNLTVDGSTGGGPGSWDSGHGIKFYTDNANTPLIGIDTSTNNVTIKHIDAGFAGSEISTGTSSTLYIIGSDNTTVEYSYLHDAPCDLAQIRGLNNFIIQFSMLARNHSSVGGCHGDVVESDGDSSNLTFRYNVILDTEGTYMFGHHTTGTLDGLYIYGNIMYWEDTETYTGFSNGMIATLNPGDNGPIVNLKFYNNTIYNSPSAQPGIQLYTDGCDGVAYNNIWDTCNTKTVNFSASNVIHDHNWYRNCGSITEENIQDGLSSPFVDTETLNFSLLSATNDGNSTIGATYNTDMLGIVRGADGIWDRGAYEYQDTSPTASITSGNLGGQMR